MTDFRPGDILSYDSETAYGHVWIARIRLDRTPTTTQEHS